MSGRGRLPGPNMKFPRDFPPVFRNFPIIPGFLPPKERLNSFTPFMFHMEELRLKVQKRAISGRGRARINTDTLARIDAGEGESLDILAGRKRVTVTAYADSLVDPGSIRVSPEDLRELGVEDGGTVTVRKAPPVAEQVTRTAKETAGAVEKEIRSAGASLKGRAGTATKEAAKTAGKVSKELEKTGKKIAGDAKKATGNLLKKRGKDL